MNTLNRGSILMNSPSITPGTYAGPTIMKEPFWQSLITRVEGTLRNAIMRSPSQVCSERNGRVYYSM
jgi:hypothetical protein